jgi:hypothetical protein
MKRLSFRSLAARASLAACALTNAPLAQAQTAAPETRAVTPNDEEGRPRVLYRQAEAAFAAGRISEARQLLLEAWSIRHTYDVASALGQAELELKLYRDAAEHLDFAVRNFAPLESEAALEGIKADLRSAKSQVAEVRVTVSEPGAAVSVDGKAVGQSPLPASVFLEQGNHAFVATLAPDRRFERSMSLARGGSYDLELALPPSRAASDDTHAAGPDYTPPIVTAITGGVALGAGIALLVLAGSKDRERDDLIAGLPGPNACQPGAPTLTECDDVSELAHSARNLRTGAVISFAAALGAGVTTYFLWPKAKASGRDAAFRAVPIFSPENGSLQLSASGRF